MSKVRLLLAFLLGVVVGQVIMLIIIYRASLMLPAVITLPGAYL